MLEQDVVSSTQCHFFGVLVVFSRQPNAEFRPVDDVRKWQLPLVGQNDRYAAIIDGLHETWCPLRKAPTDRTKFRSTHMEFVILQRNRSPHNDIGIPLKMGYEFHSSVVIPSGVEQEQCFGDRSIVLVCKLVT